MITAKGQSCAKMSLCSAALVVVGGSVLGLVLVVWGLAGRAFGFGAAHLGLGQLWASEHRGGRLIGFTLVLGGAFTVVDAAIWMLT